MNLKLNLANVEAFKKIATKLEDPDQTYQNFVNNLAKYHFQVKAIVQVMDYNIIIIFFGSYWF